MMSEEKKMELFLDSVDFNEMTDAKQMGILTGITTTPTFMYRHGISDIDAAIVKISGLVENLHVEAMGDSAAEIRREIDRIMGLPLKHKPVFKIPVSNHGIGVCRQLVQEGHRVNIHLVYTLNQAYMAMEAGATYVCTLAGRLHDQGHDAFKLIEQMVTLTHRFNYPSKIMVGSVRHPEHVRQVLLLGAHACTVPWHVMKILSHNSLTQVGTDQFLEHSRLMTVKAIDIIRENNPVCKMTDSVMTAIDVMTESRLGAVSIVDSDHHLVGIFTDGDLRRQLKKFGSGFVNKKMSEFSYPEPVTISANALLHEAVEVFSHHEFDNIIVVENRVPVGMIDIQDLVKMKLLG